MDNSSENIGSVTPTKLTKYSTPFTIESLIANHHHQQASANKSADDAMSSVDVSEELSARAMVASSALGLTNFPLYNPWLHGYFAQNHDRITQFFANSGEYNMPLNLLSKEPPSSANASTTAQQTLNLSKSPSVNDTENSFQSRLFLNPNFGLSIVSAAANNSSALNANSCTPVTINEALLQHDLNSSQRLAEIMAASGCLADNVQNLSTANRFAHNMGKVLTDVVALNSAVQPNLFSQQHLTTTNTTHEPLSNASVKNHSEASLDVSGLDEDYDCSGDSCSDISLTMSPQNYRNETDKNRSEYWIENTFLLSIFIIRKS